MKLPFDFDHDLVTRGSVLAIAGFAIFVLAENGCSGSSAPASTAADAGGDTGVAGCFAGEALTQVGSQSLCCSGTAPNLVCNAGGRVGDPCSAASSPATQTLVNVTLDVCVSDDCSGDHNPSTYDSKTVAVTTPLTCTNGALAAAGAPVTQEVDRVCADTGALTCANGYGYGYGYYGGSALETRAPSVTSSTCTTSNNAPTPCDVGSF